MYPLKMYCLQLKHALFIKRMASVIQEIIEKKRTHLCSMSSVT